MSLLPYTFKKYSSILILSGGLLLYFYFQGVKPTWLQVPVFAIVSTYIESRYVQMVETNLMDELGFILCISGLVLLVFTEEKNEINQSLNSIRLDAFMTSSLVTLLMWIVLYLLIFGYAILFISIIIFPTFVLLYYLILRFKISKIKG